MFKKLFLMVLIVCSLPSLATEVLVWDKAPLSLRLEVGKERIVSFGNQNVVVGVPASLRSKLRVQSAAGVAYLEPVAAFPSQRVEFKLVESNTLIFIDVFAAMPDDEAPLEPAKVLIKRALDRKKQEEAARVGELAGPKATPIDLTRYAAQSFYAPSRLLDDRWGIAVTDLGKIEGLDLLFGGTSAGLFKITPVKQFAVNGMFLSALLLENQSSYPQVFRHPDIYPIYEFATPQHMNMGASGAVDDHTMLYLITRKPLNSYSEFVGF